MLAAKLDTFGASAWRINSGWVGGPYGIGERCKLKYTRSLIDAIHDGTLDKLSESDWETTDVFNLKIPKVSVKGVPMEILRPESAWVASGQSRDAYLAKARELAGLFQDNFGEYADKCEKAVLDAAPKA
eukprot:TRINITY_DN89_c1_g1_i1.p1 TRINITY_DN89_c1_g1~~TRINITY_DN89_c1_g1_i1.p1  ORF type:complete len:137 (+),score=40.23 TRINITY_DN89_c1_g1_i1:25-411(+)